MSDAARSADRWWWHRWRPRAVVPPLLAASLAAALLGAPLALGMLYHGLDLTLLDVAMGCELRQLVGAGQELWLSERLGLGAPFALRPEVQLFYPPRWLLLPFSVELAASLGVVLHAALAAAGAAHLLQSWRARAGTAVAAGLLYVLAGTSLNLFVHTSSFHAGAAWLPWAWTLARHLLRGAPRRRHSIGLVVALAMMLLAGDPQSFGLAAAVVGGEAAGTWWRRRGRARRRLVLALAAPGLALLVAMAQWLGLLIEGTLSRRARPLPLAEVVAWSYDATLWLATLWPRPLGLDSQLDLWRSVLGDPTDARVWNPTPYLGGALLALALVGLWRRRARLAAVVLLGSLGLSLGAALPGWELLYRALPWLGQFRHPQRHLPLTTLALIAVAAIAVDELGRREPRRQLRVAATGLLLLQVVLIGGLLAGQPALDAWSAESFAQASISLVRSQLAGLLVPVLALLALLALPRRPRWRSLAALVAVGDLLVAAPASIHLGPSLLELRSPVSTAIDALGRSQQALCIHSNIAFYSLRVPGTQAAQAWSGTAAKRLLLQPELHACDGIASPLLYSPLQSQAAFDLETALSRGELAAARALGCSHVLVDAALDPAQVDVSTPTARSGLLAGGQGLRLLAVREPVPAAFVAIAPTLAPSWNAALPRLLQARNLREALAVVDDPLQRWPADHSVPGGTNVTLASVEWTGRSRATVHLKGQGGALVGLRSAFLVGWQARQAGRTLPLLRVAGQHLAAVVPDAAAGPVEFAYRSPGWRAGLTLAAVGCGLTLLLPMVLLRRRPGLP